MVLGAHPLHYPTQWHRLDGVLSVLVTPSKGSSAVQGNGEVKHISKHKREDVRGAVVGLQPLLAQLLQGCNGVLA